MLRKRSLYKIVGLCIILFVLTKILYMSKRSHQNDDSKLKIQLIERSIRSTLNQGACQHTDLPVYNPEIMKFYKPVKSINCNSSLEDWVVCKGSICFVRPKITDYYGDMNCSYTDIIREDNFSISYGKPTYTTKPYVLRNSDFVRVICQSDMWYANKTWSGYAYGIRNTVRLPDVKMTHPPLYNVLIFGFDSMSRNAFIRKLPKSYEYLTRELKTIVLKGYNIVGDGTSQALVPLLTGYTELELSAADTPILTSKTNAVSIDAYPMIWKEYAKHGYVTSFNEDLSILTKLTYRLKYFIKQPVHHYLQTFYVELGRKFNILKKFCIGHRPRHQVMLDYTKNFMSKYNKIPGFIFSFHGDLSLKSINHIGAIDNDFLLWLQQLKNDKFLDNTILIVMSDHGNRLSKARNTLQGKQEERLPFFSFTFPKSFKNRYPQEYQNFLQNSNGLSTPFDIHATLKDILALQHPEDTLQKISKQFLSYTRNRSQFGTNAPDRAISLFKNPNLVPENRSCADAYIEPHWCACLKWEQLSLSDSVSYYIIAMKGAESILSTINNYTNEYYMICARLRLKGVNWLLKLNTHSDEFTDDRRRTVDFYQIQIVTQPGDTIFEASFQYDSKTNVYDTNIFQISRINYNGVHATCIYMLNPDLRKYCYCQP